LKNETFFETNLFGDQWLSMGAVLYGKRLIGFFVFAPLLFLLYLKLIRSSRIVYFRQERKFNLYYLTAFVLSILGAESLSSLLFPHFLDTLSKTFRESLTGNSLNFILLAFSIAPLIFLTIEIYHDKPERPRKSR